MTAFLVTKDFEGVVPQNRDEFINLRTQQYQLLGKSIKERIPEVEILRSDPLCIMLETTEEVARRIEEEFMCDAVSANALFRVRLLG